MYSLNLYTAASFLTFLSENLLFTGALILNGDLFISPEHSPSY